MYELYKTDSSVEKNGKELLFADGMIRVKLARAGGSNQRFEKILAANSKPYRRAIQAELITNEKANELLMATYAEAIVLSWETLVEKEDGTEEYVSGIMLEDSEDLQPVNKENIMKVFKSLPDLFKEMAEEANKLTNYRSYAMEEDAKN
jgi:hypothetical protein